MSKPKKKEYWLVWHRQNYKIFTERSCCPSSGLAFLCADAWHKTVAPPGSRLRLREDTRIKISITPTKTGFSVRAIGKAEKI